MRWLYKFPLRLRSILKHRCVEQELSEELRFHQEKLTEEYVARGLSLKEAHYAALRALGGVEQVKEECRDMRRMSYLENLIQDIRYGLRQLRRNPGFTMVAVLTLGLGIGANTAIFSLIDSVMLRMLPVVKPDELLQVKTLIPSRPGEPSGAFTNPLWEQVRDQQGVFSDVFAWGEATGREDLLNFDLTHGGAVHPARGIWVSGGFFGGLGLRPAAGRLIAPSDDQRSCRGVAVLSYGFWQEHYGGEDRAVGASLMLGGHPFEVIGVAPAGFFGMEVGEKFDVAVPICAAAIFDGEKSRLDHRGWWWLQVAGRIKPEISQAQVRARLRALSPGVFTAALPQDWAPEWQRNFVKRTLTAVPAATGISEFGLRAQFGRPLDILMGVVGVVLLIACANIASLMLARAAARHKEIAVRQALGASRLRLVRQLLMECLLVSGAGALLGALFSRWGTALMIHSISTARNSVFLDLSPDTRILGFTALLAVLTGIVFGLLPALRSTRVSLTAVMKGGSATEMGRFPRFRARRWTVSSQVALSFVLLVAAGLLLRSFAKLATLDLGFDRSNVLLVSTDLKSAKVPPERQLAAYEGMENRLRALPGIVSVGRSLLTPIQGGGWSQPISTDWSKELTDNETETWFNAVSPGYLAALRMSLLAGRNFSGVDITTSPKVAIVNQTLARRFFPGLNPLGRTFRIQGISGQPGPPIEVVGLIKDAKYESVDEDTHPTAFFPITQLPERAASKTFELRTAIPPSALVSSVQSAVASVNKGAALEIYTLAEQVNDSLVQQRMLALLSGFFGGLALLLAMVGLYGTFNYLVSQRQTEFGIRMALGAGGSSILRLMLRDLLVALAAGLAAGGCISLAATRVLQQMLFGLGPHDALTMIAAAGVLSAVAIFAGYFPARRATKVDPMVALRWE